MALGLSDFEGNWLMTREINDLANGCEGRFVGRVAFELEWALLRYTEEGQLSFADQLSLAAEQTHLWREEAGRIHVCFADGRPFHCFDPGGITATGRHDCRPDAYEVSYDFASWPIWRTTWTVRGPRKAYDLQTEYQRT